MIYDAFPFFNELELLELRLHELAPVVDRFVLVEATRTHANRPKPLYFAENRDRFRAFAERITHVVLDDLPDSDDAWELEKSQRDGILRGLAGCRPDDVILISDVDEIPRAEKVREAVAWLRPPRFAIERLAHALLRSRWVRHPLRRLFKRRHPFLIVFELTPYWGWLNLHCPDQHFRGSRMCLYRDLTRPRELRGLGGRIVRDAGWHFSFMGGVERIRTKLAAGAHRELDTAEFTDPERIARLLAGGGDILGKPARWERVEIGADHPRHLREHPERWAGWIMPAGRAPS